MKCKYKENCGYEYCLGDCCPEFEAAVETNADRMSMMLRENDANGLLDWWQEIFEDGVPSEDYFKWWLKQPAEVDGNG